MITTTRARLAALLLGSAGVAFPLSVQAQTAPVVDTTAAPAQAGTADETAATDRLEDVTVVARKRAESVQAVPIPITVISPVELTRQNLVSFTDFQTKLPAFSVYLTNPKQLNLGVRGIGNNGFNTDGIDGIDGSVGVFVDGVYTGRQGMASSDFNDVAQVDHKRLDLQLWVTNLFDKAYFINLLGYTKSTGIVQGYPGNPRAFGGTARVHF